MSNQQYEKKSDRKIEINAIKQIPMIAIYTEE